MNIDGEVIEIGSQTGFWEKDLRNLRTGLNRANLLLCNSEESTKIQVEQISQTFSNTYCLY